MVLSRDISPFNGQFPRELAFLREAGMKRISVFDGEQLQSKLKQYLRFNNTYYSVYGFQGTNENGYRCDYNTAIIDRLFFDFDESDQVTITDENDDEKITIIVETNPWAGAYRLHLWCMKHKLSHCIVFSGRGYHVYIFTVKQLLEYPRDTVLKASVEICTKAGYNTKLGQIPLNADIRAMGRPDQLARVIGSFNYKAVARGDSKGYVIPITAELMAKGHDEVVKHADKQRGTHMIVYGEKLLNLDIWDDGTYVTKERFYLWNKNTEERTDFNKIGEPLSATLEIADAYHLFPPCIQTVIVSMQKRKIPYDTILQISTFLRDAGWTIEEQLTFWYQNYLENKNLTFTDFVKQETPWFEHTYGIKRGSRRGGYHAFTCETSRQRASCPFGQNSPQQIEEVGLMKFGEETVQLIVVDASAGNFKKACHKWMCGEMKQDPDIEKETSYAISYYEDMRRQLLQEPIIENPEGMDDNLPPCIVARMTKGISSYTARAIVSVLYWSGYSRDRIDEIMGAINIPPQVYSRMLTNPSPMTCASLTRKNLCIKPDCKWANSWGNMKEFDMMDGFERDGIVYKFKTGFLTI